MLILRISCAQAIFLAVKVCTCIRIHASFPSECAHVSQSGSNIHQACDTAITLSLLLQETQTEEGFFILCF